MRMTMIGISTRVAGRKWRCAVFSFLILCLSALSSRAQSVSLAWNPGPPASTAGYFLYLGTISGNYTTRIDVGTNTVATISGLVAGQIYYFVVTAYNSARVESLPSNEATFVAPAGGSGGLQLAAVSPASASPGTQVLIYGAGFASTTSVQIGGVSASYTVSSDGLLIVTVPTATSGLLKVTTSQGVVTANFNILPAVAPANDNFNNAQALSGTVAMAATNTIGATKQSGEPNHAGNTGGHSVWYRWTAPATGTWSLDTIGSSFTTLLAVYTGNSVSSLSLKANNLVAGTLTNALTFNATAGTVYQIAVDGYNGASGNLTLHLDPSANATIYSTGFEASSGFNSTLALAGQSGWVSLGGTATNGIRVNAFPGLGQQGFVGFGSSIPTSASQFYVPFNYSVNTNTSPVIQFSVTMQISAPSPSSQNNSTFGWIVRNASGQELFRIFFDDTSKFITYTLDNGNGPVYTGIGFDNATVYNLIVTMDFAHNQWTATLNGATLAIRQPLTTAGSALTLGDIDAGEVFRSTLQAGTDGMLFDNYLVTAGPPLTPVILEGPLTQTLPAGNSAVLGTVASGAPALSYQWYCNNGVLTNATNASLVLPGVTSSQAGYYSVLVSNAYGVAFSAATLAVTTPPPQSLFAAPVSLGAGGALLTLSVSVGNNYRLEASTNLQDWVTVESFLAMSTNALCFDTGATNGGSRFYRLASP